MAGLAAVAWLLGAAGAPPPPVCSGTDDTTRPLSPALVPLVQQRFGLAMPPEYAARTTVVRCAGGHLLACSLGADLPCGKADTRTAIPAADRWCAANPGAATVPAYVTGHATLYAWRCAGDRAVIARQVAHADARGFVAEYWKPLD